MRKLIYFTLGLVGVAIIYKKVRRDITEEMELSINSTVNNKIAEYDYEQDCLVAAKTKKQSQ